MNNCINLKQKINKKLYCKKRNKEINIKECSNCKFKEYKVNNYKIKKRTSKLAKAERNRFSIIYDDLTRCCICNSKCSVEKNEVFEGACRQKSISLGMICPFCTYHHKLFHEDAVFNLKFKVMFEKEYLKVHTKEEFIKNFGQDYIYKLEHKKRT